MKGKRHTTEDKIRILREADGGRTIGEICKEKNISEVTFHRWKREFGIQIFPAETRNSFMPFSPIRKENNPLRISAWVLLLC